MPVATLDEPTIEAWLSAIPDWRREGNQIVRQLKLPSFADAISFVNMVAQLAEELNHHPDILIHYREVTLTLSTHEAGGLTKADFDLAKRIDALPLPNSTRSQPPL
jgi:4a-hydroxytetrahydrobiopterin dehydratase